MAAEMNILIGEFYSIVAIVTFMKRVLQRAVGFYEVVVPSYSMDEFRSHNRNFRTENVYHSRFSSVPSPTPIFDANHVSFSRDCFYGTRQS